MASFTDKLNLGIKLLYYRFSDILRTTSSILMDNAAVPNLLLKKKET